MTNRSDEKALRSFLERRALPAQAEAITAEEPLVAVSAGAGTGKTWTLAWRFLWAVATGRSRAGQILTLTFTDKAALEMESRIRSLAEEALSDLPADPELKDIRSNLEGGLLELDDGYISTIHSFARRVIRESGLSLAADPASRVVSGPERDLFWSRTEEALDRLDRRWAPGRREVFESKTTREILSLYGPKEVASFCQNLVDLCAGRGDGPEDLDRWAGDVESGHKEALREVILSLKPLWEKEYLRWFGPGGIMDEIEPDGSEFSKKLAALAKGRSRYESDPGLFVKDLHDKLKNARGKLSEYVGSSLPQGAVKDYRTFIGKWLPFLNLAMSGWSEKELELTSGLLSIGAMCWDAWERWKARRGLTSFDDMLAMAGKALSGSPSYALRFKEILIDEFQDVSGVQDLLIRSLRENRAEPPRLFLVGDPKQSIYRFRHADLSLFGKYLAEAKKPGGKYVALDVSFRTRDDLLDKTSKLFSGIWKDGLGGSLKASYEPLRPPSESPWHRSRQDISVPAWQVLLTPRGEDGEPAEEKRERSAREIAKKLISIKESCTVWDKDALSARPMAWRDAAVLVRTRTAFPALRKVLGDRCGIPLHFEKNTAYYGRSEVEDCVSLLRCLADPKDELALGGYLSSPLSSLSLEEAETLISKAPPGGLWKAAAELYPKITKELLSLRETGRMKGASSVMEVLVSRGELLEGYAPWRRRDAAANLRRAVDLLREYEAVLGRGLIGPSSWIARALRQRVREEEPSPAGQDEDAVRAMTVHAAKGLEFPVVILPFCDEKPKGSRPSARVSGRLGAVISESKIKEASGPRVHGFLEEKAQREEEERLFYVACTRARDCLIMEGAHDPIPREGAWLTEILKRGLPFEFSGEKSDGAAPRKVPDKAPVPKCGPVIRTGSAPGGLERMSPTSWALYRHCPKAWRLRFRQGLELPWGRSTDGEPGGADLGSMVHWILERWDFSKKGLGELLNRDAATVPPDIRGIFTGESRDLAVSWLEALLESPEGERLRDLDEKGRLKREVPFRVPLKDGPLLAGSVDVMWKEGESYFIRDYKTAASADFPGFYSDQVRLYGLAVHAVFSPESVDMGLYAVRDRWEVRPVTLSPYRSWQELEDQVREDAASASAGPWEPRTDRCGQCPFRDFCLSPKSR